MLSSVFNEVEGCTNESPFGSATIPAAPTSPVEVPRPRRLVCPQCERPQAQACICSALPERRLNLEQCHCLVLQHPHETRRKNRSLFLAELSLTADSLTKVRGRSLRGPSSPDKIAKLMAADRKVWLVYPHPQALSLRQALADWRALQQQQETPAGDPPHSKARLTIIFLDATWKFARQMEKASQFPPHIQRVQLRHDHDLMELEKMRRFDIRTPPSPSHLSTAECLALVVSRVEDRPGLYDSLMRPLDLMVSQWHSFASQTKASKGGANTTTAKNGDDD
jgi:DTW domain-containing protein YfiP